MNLAIDIGNSNFHLAVFNKKHTKYYCSGLSGNIHLLSLHLKIIAGKYNITKIGYSSVVPKLDKRIIGIIKKIIRINPLSISYKSKLPVKIKVKNPHSLGSDRICNAVYGFTESSENSNSLVIDLGTANKYDLVLSSGNYIGGIIAPGLITSSKALSSNTGKLPVLKIEEFNRKTPLIGRNTPEALQSGLVNYMWYATEGIVTAVKKKYPGKLTIFLSGGSAGFIKNSLSFKYKYAQNSVLRGINQILSNQ